MQLTIIGGGPAGLTTAIVLKQAGLAVTLLEAGDYSAQRAGEHLGAAGSLLLKTMGIPAEILLENSIPCKEIAASWGQAELHYKSSVFNPYGDGFILSRPAFDRALATYAKSIGITLIEGFRVRALQKNGKTWTISNGKEVLEADFVVDASGRNSKFSSLFGATKTRTDDLMGISKLLPPTGNKNQDFSHLLIESVAKGWWYSVQLPSGVLALTLMTDIGVLKESGLSQAAFWQAQLALAPHTISRCSSFLSTEKTFTQSAKTHLLEPMIGTDWLAVGDAAVSYDPLSSAGILKGLRMGQLAAQKIAAHLKGDTEALEEYEQTNKERFEEYALQKTAYYAQENRFSDQAFWYHRNCHPSKIENFTILPQQQLKLIDTTPNTKLRFLSRALPTIDFPLLVACIGEHAPAHLVLKTYLEKKGAHRVEKEHFQALEALKRVGVVVNGESTPKG